MSRPRTSLKVSYRPDRATGQPWRVRYPENDKWRFRAFATREEGEVFAEQKRIQINNEGRSAGNLTDEERYEAVLALRLLRPRGMNLLDAVKQAVAAYDRVNKSCTMAQLLAEKVRVKRPKAFSNRHDYQASLIDKKIEKAFGDRMVSEITEEEVQNWLASLPVASNTTRINYLKAIAAAFAFACKRRYLTENPAADIKLPKAIPKDTEIYTPQEVNAILLGADDEVRAALAIAAFTGVRTAELQRLNWRDVCLIKNTITIWGKSSKTRQRRVIPIQPNLRAWLLPLAKLEGSVVPEGCESVFYRKRRAAFKNAGVKQKNNAMRHSFCSYRFAATKNEHVAALDAGHDPRILFSNYRAIVSDEDAARYWNIFPPDDAKVITLHLPPMSAPATPALGSEDRAASVG